MDYKHIHSLLDAYWTGTSSPEEERQLKAFFSQAELPEELKAYQAYFAYLSMSGQLTSTRDISARPAIPLYKRPRWQVWAVAATILCVLGIGYMFQTYQTHETPEVNTLAEVLPADTFEDPEEAYETAKKALLLVSSKFKKGKAMMFNPDQLSPKKDEE